ncbi:surface protease GP63, partial [Trypanosoma cruzi]
NHHLFPCVVTFASHFSFQPISLCCLSKPRNTFPTVTPMVQWLLASPCPAALPLLLMMLTLMCCSSGCFAASLTYHCSFDDAMRVGRTKSMPMVMKNVP